jgi:hypothetical protein
MSHSIPHHQSHPICPILIMGHPILHEWDALAQDGTSHLTRIRYSGTRWDVPSYINGMLWHKMGCPILHEWDALAQDGMSHLIQMGCSAQDGMSHLQYEWDALTQDGMSHLIWMGCSAIRWDVPCCEPVKYKLTIILCNIPHYRYSRCIHSLPPSWGSGTIGWWGNKAIVWYGSAAVVVGQYYDMAVWESWCLCEVFQSKRVSVTLQPT